MSTTTRKAPKVRKDALGTDAAVADLVARFEAGTLPAGRFTHRAHLAVAASYLRDRPFPQALDRVRTYIQLFNNRCGTREGYHETVTVVFLRAVAAYLEAHPGVGVAAAVPELAAAYDMTWVRRFYSPEVLVSAEAKAGWVKPDVAPVEF
jgi:hypothetical protein